MNNLGRLLRRMPRMTIIACLVLLPNAISAMAPRQTESQAGNLQISISMDAKELKTGDQIFFDTVVTNVGTEKTSPMIIAMNIINLNQAGDVVDPEDWSPERTQYLDALAPNESTTLSWQVNAVLDGNFMVYMVAVPEPDGKGTSSQAVASRGLHLSVARYTKLNPGGVLPYAVGMPAMIGLVIFLLFKFRNRQIDMGETS